MPTSRGDNVRGKQIAITAVIALVVVVGFNTYQAKKQG
jgi:predicted negative regulator of RcsB-dependent stress response